MSQMDRLDRVVSDLERDQNLSRIKKLLYCCCYGVWEDNRTRLEQVGLRDIVCGVWERSPTLDALQFQLNRIVKTLNKPVEYAHVANVILRSMTRLYQDAYDITRPLSRPPAVPTPTPLPSASTQWLGAESLTPSPQPQPIAELEAQAVQALASHPEAVRLKKLLICVCKNTWENDSAKLAAIDWTALTKETQELIPSLENLDYVLQAIVKSLSKPLDYLPIAHQLIKTFRPLYENRPNPTETLFYGIDNSPARPQPEPTEFYQTPASAEEERTSPLVPLSPSSSQSQPQFQPQFQTEEGEVPTGLMRPLPVDDPGTPERFPPALVETADAAAVSEATPNALDKERNSGVSVSKQAAPEEEEDFALRLDIMRYANPLMVKIVLFSSIHRLFQFTEQDWTELRHHTLVGLIKTLRRNYPNFTDLEAKLCLTAESIELQENAMKTVAAILKVLQPHYDEVASVNGTPERRFMLPQAQTNSLEDELAALAAVLEEDEDENSCQVF